jgi:hypothetical protein
MKKYKASDMEKDWGKDLEKRGVFDSMNQEQERKFEDYLAVKFMEDYHGDKEHYESAFDGWLENLDGNELIEYGNKAIDQAVEAERERIRGWAEKKYLDDDKYMYIDYSDLLDFLTKGK